MLEKLVTTKDVLDMSGVSRYTLYRDIMNGKIKCIRLSSRVNRFRLSDAQTYAEQKKNGGRSEKWKKEKMT